MVVASVAGCGEVTKPELEHWTRMEKAAGQGTHAGTVVEVAMDLLITWTCENAEARQHHIVVSASEVANEIALIRTSELESVALERLPNETAVRVFLRNGQVSQADRNLLVKMAITKVRARAEETMSAEGSISSGDIRRYYQRHLSSFETPERRDIRSVINVDEGKVLRARQEIEAGVPFRIVERRFNGSTEGGLHLGMVSRHLPARYERDFFSAPLHVLIGPRKEAAYYLFEVFHRIAPRVRPLSQVEARIRALLARAQVNSQLKAREASRRGETTCVTGYAGNRCGRNVAKLGH